MSLPKLIIEKLRKYYTTYYRDTLGLPDFEKRIASRLLEDENYQKIVEQYKDLIPFFYTPVDKQKVLILGAGTGAEFITFYRMGYDVYGIEPSEDACEILWLKCDHYGIPRDKIIKGIGEALPYENESIDFVWSWTVLEHVQDVQKTLDEIKRVLKIGSWAFLCMPDYRQFWEGHYKLYLPMFMPKFFIKIILRLKGRPTGFLDWGINYINAKEVRNYLAGISFQAMFLFVPWSDEWKRKRSGRMNMIFQITNRLGIQRDQIWIIRKINE